ncbi:MAG: hypothetical protein WKF93_10430 [Acidimicrobiales bacterium]
MSDPSNPDQPPPGYPQQPPTGPVPPTEPTSGGWQSTGAWGPTPTGAPPPTGQWGAPPPAGPPPTGQWGVPPPAGPPPTGQWGAPPPGGPGLPSTGPVPPGGNRKKFIPVAIGTVVVLAAGTFAFTQISSSDGGAGTPEEALDGFMSALADEDVIGMLDSFTPGERDALRNLTQSTSDELERLGVVGETFQLEGVPGIDIVLSDDVEFEVVEEVVPDQLALVAPSAGEMTITFDPDALEEGLVGDTLRDLIERSGGDADLAGSIEEEEVDIDLADLAEEAGGFAGAPAGFAAIDEGDGWHLSLGYTIAENARQSELALAEEFGDDVGALDDAPDIDDPAIAPEGAESPEAAVTALIEATGALDLERVIALLDPEEMGVLQVYSQYFIDEINSAADGVDIPSGGFIEITDLEADVTDAGNGGQRVTPTAISADVDAGEAGSGSFTLEGECITVDAEFDGETIDDEFCAGDEDVLNEAFGIEDADVELPDELIEAQEELAGRFEDIQVGIVTVERDGQHFISPVRTFNDVLIGLSSIFETEDFEEGALIDDIGSGFTELFNEAFDPFEGDEPIIDDPIDPDDEQEERLIGVLADELLAVDPSLGLVDAECVAEEGPIFELGIDELLELEADGFPGLGDPSTDLGAAVIEGLEFCGVIGGSTDPEPPDTGGDTPIPDAPPLGAELTRGQAGRALVPADGEVRVTIVGDGPGVLTVRSVDGVVDPVITLFDAAGNEIGRDDDGLDNIDPNLPTFDSELVIDLAPGTSAVAVVTDFGGSDTGEVVIIYE